MISSFKRLLVLQDDSPLCPVWTKQAAQLADKWGSRILGLHVEPKIVKRNYYDSSVGDDLGDVQASVEKRRQATVLDRFDDILRNFDTRSEWMAMVGDPIVETRRSARYTDLAVLSYPGKQSDDLGDLRRIVEHVAVGSGCPTLVIPASFDSEIELDKVAVCWDGSREAVRALRDALELLTAATSVDILIADEDDDARPQTSGDQIKELLHAHDINANVHEISPSHRNVGKDLLSKTHELGSQVIVLGAYGHSRLRDLVLGGVTQHMLRNTTVPLFLSH